MQSTGDRKHDAQIEGRNEDGSEWIEGGMGTKKLTTVPSGFILVSDGVGVFSVRRVETFSELLKEIGEFFGDDGLGIDSDVLTRAIKSLRSSKDLSVRAKVKSACRAIESEIGDGTEVELMALREATSGRLGASIRLRYREGLKYHVESLDEDEEELNVSRLGRVVAALETLDAQALGPSEIEPFLEWLDSEASG